MKKNTKTKSTKVDSLFHSAKKYLEEGQYKKAYELLKEAAPSGNLFVLSELKRTYLYHIAPELEGEHSRANLEKKIKKGDVCAAIKLAEQYIDKQQDKKAFNLLSKFEKTNNPEILHLLANCYYFGSGVKENEKMASQYYLRAAIAGSPGAQYKLGLIFYTGDLEMPKNEVEGLKWLLIANDQGYPVFALLAHSHDGFSVNPSKENTNYKKLYECALDAIDRKKADDYYLLGLCFYTGHGVKASKEKAFKYFALAAKQNHPIALAHMSEYYSRKKDYKKAYEYAEKSSKNGCSYGDVLLGDCYFNGYYVKQDYDQAFAYYKKGYDAGSQYAQWRFDVRRMY